MTNRTRLLTSAVGAPITWAALLLFARFVPPTSVQAISVVFVLLALALTTTLTPIIYVIGSRILIRRKYHMSVSQALRLSLLVTLAAMLNLFLLLLRSWNIFTAIVVCLAAVIVGVLLLAGR